MADTNRVPEQGKREWEPHQPRETERIATVEPICFSCTESDRETTEPQPTQKEPKPKEKTNPLNDIKVIKIDDDPPSESVPKPSVNDGNNNRKPNEPNREDSLDSNESFKRRNVRMPLSKGPPTFIEKVLIFLSYLLTVIFFPTSLFCIFMVVRQFERVVILRNGKVRKNQVFGPGLIHYLPCVDMVKFLDLRIICYAVPPQEALTKDSLTVSIDAVVYYKICDPISAVINVADYRSSTQFLAATMLRNALGTRKLADLLMDRPAVCYQIFHKMKRVASDWGISIVRVEVKEISLPVQLQKAMAAEAESSRHANAKIIVANAEIESTKNLRVATNILMDNPLCMQLRYLQSLQMIAGNQTHTIVFPFSIEHIRKIFK